MKIRKLSRLFRRANRSIKWILAHPLAKKNPITALWRYFCYHLLFPLTPGPIIYPWIDRLSFVVKPGMAGMVGNIYARLEDPEEMGILIHFLRENDLFVDVGANMGSYSLLASGICRARSIAFEPAPETYFYLKVNRTLNKLENLLRIYQCAVAAQSGSVNFTENLGVLNHIVPNVEKSIEKCIRVPACSLDGKIKKSCPGMLKIDVEGYELEVLRGATTILSNETLKVVIIELHSHEDRAGDRYELSHKLLKSYGFNPFSYDPFQRVLTRQDTFNRKKFNTIYVRDIKFVNMRIKESRAGEEIFKSG